MLVADEFEELWIDLSNQLIRKRLVKPEIWEELIRFTYDIMKARLWYR